MSKKHFSLLIIGASGSGKSFLSNYLIMKIKTKYKIIIDPSAECSLPGFYIVEISPFNYKQVLQNFGQIVAKYKNIIVQFDFLTIEQQKEVVNYIAGLLPHIRNVTLMVDETHLYAPQHSPAPNLLLVATMGRKYGVNSIFITQRPQQLNSTLRSQTNFKIVMHMDDPRDIEAIRSYMYKAELAPFLPEHYFLYRNKNGKVFLGTTDGLNVPHRG